MGASRPVPKRGCPVHLFVIVCLSFMIINGIKINEIAPALLSIIAAFPLGFIIQTIHRWLHVSCCEQSSMRREEYELLDENLKKYIAKLAIPNTSEPDVAAQITCFSLDKEENKSFIPRITFLNTYWLSLGASTTAIVIALLVCVIFLLTFSSIADDISLFSSLNIILFILWIVAVTIFWCHRNRVKRDYQICRNIFIKTVYNKNWN